MHNIDNRSDALTYLANLIACYRDFQAMARDSYGPVLEAWQTKVSFARRAVLSAIYFIRENDYEGAW